MLLYNIYMALNEIEIQIINKKFDTISKIMNIKLKLLEKLINDLKIKKINNDNKAFFEIFDKIENDLINTFDLIIDLL